MKIPAFLKTVALAVAGFGKKAGGVASSAFAKAREAADRLRRGLDPRAAMIIALAVAGLALAIVAIAVIGAVSRASGIRPNAKAESAAPIATAESVTAKLSGKALASQLLIPGDGERPYPLALEPKPRYTQAEADAVRPDLGAVDVSPLTRRRKAELEAIFSAVD